MEILIAGAGIGGLALANGLVADGHRVRVLEAAPELREGGAAVTIFSNGAAALAGLGVPLPGSIGGRIDILESRTAAGKRVFAADLTVMRRKTGYPVMTVARDKLLGHLASGLPDRIVEFGRPVVSVSGGTVFDGAGGEHRPEVVVGADGHRSAVRAGILNPKPAKEVGWTTWQGLTHPDSARGLTAVANGAAGILLVGDAGLVGLMPAGGGLLQWWFDVEGALPEGSAVAALRRRFHGYAAPVPELLEAVTDEGLGRFPHVLHEVPDAWGTGPATLLGDAAHVFPPSQAQGANQALEDAWLLRRALANAGSADVSARLRKYERLRAVRVRRVSRMAASEQTNKPPNALARAAVKLVPASMAGSAYTALVRRFSSVLASETI